MPPTLETMVAIWPTWALLVAIAVSIAVLGKSADRLVETAVALSLRWGVPSVVVGATVVSLGTTTPEAGVSVLAALKGEPGLALGNAVGSIICDTGLILGAACVLSPLPFDRSVANRQGWVQFGCGLLLVACCMPWLSLGSALTAGGRLAQASGWVFLVLLAGYLYWSVRLARRAAADAPPDAHAADESRSLAVLAVYLTAAVAVVVAASSVLIAAATEMAERIEVPPSIIAATLVAFGTSLPELVIVLTATLKGQGALAVGNVIGADILNVLFVAGAAAAVTPGGLFADPHFFTLQFPAMVFVLTVFRVGTLTARDGMLRRPFGYMLLAAYICVTAVSYWQTT